MVEKERIIKLSHVLDAAGYYKTCKRYFYRSGQVQSDTIIESMSSIWGYENTHVSFKEYDSNGKCKNRGHYERHHSIW